MEIQINVSGNPSSMTQANAHRIKRCSNVLIEAGFNVNIHWDAYISPDAPKSPKHPLRTTITHY